MNGKSSSQSLTMTPLTWALLGALGITGGTGSFFALRDPVVNDTPLTVGIAEIMHAKLKEEIIAEIAMLRRKVVRDNISELKRDIDSWLTVPEDELTLAQRINLTELQDQLRRDRDELQDLER